MTVLLFGKRASQIQSLVEKLGFSIVQDNPEVIITYGGDGTLLSAERQYPSVPKLAIRDSQICIKCQDHQDQVVLSKLRANQLKLLEFDKLEAKFLNEQLLATNDLVIRNQTPIHAIRFHVHKNGKSVSSELLIGDGVVAATAFGSTGYFRSITRKDFVKDFALAFNNTTISTRAVYFKKGDVIKITVKRGPAGLTYDNSSQIWELGANVEVTITPSDQKLLIYDSSIRCRNCRMVRQN